MNDAELGRRRKLQTPKFKLQNANKLQKLDSVGNLPQPSRTYRTLTVSCNGKLKTTNINTKKKRRTRLGASIRGRKEGVPANAHWRKGAVRLKGLGTR
jgi:hypothetical protein